jgi:phosphonate transport system ATP-binding protein
VTATLQAERVAAGAAAREPTLGARAETVVAVRGLVKRFGAGAPVIDGLDLDIARGTAVAVIGANGTGKSTFVRALVRLVEPTAGEVFVLGRDVRALRGRELRRLRSRVGFVFQKHNLVPRLSALTNVVHGALGRTGGFRLWHQAFAPSAIRLEALECLARVGLVEKASARVDTLSGGQSQRVAIARMLMQRPELVIADEPDASLDPKSGEEVMELLGSLCRERGVTLIVVSHRMEHALRHADRIVGLAGGAVALDTPARATSEDALKGFFHHG